MERERLIFAIMYDILNEILAWEILIIMDFSENFNYVTNEKKQPEN